MQINRIITFEKDAKVEYNAIYEETEGLRITKFDNEKKNPLSSVSFIPRQEVILTLNLDELDNLIEFLKDVKNYEAYMSANRK